MEKSKINNLFSFIIPVHNGAGFIAEAVQSVRAANLPACEIIVIDDGSTDDTAQVVASLGVRYVYQTQRGPAAARNRGFELAEGEIIGFLDADDWWSPPVLRQCLEILQTQTQYDIVQGLIQDVPAMSDVYPYINLGSAIYRRSAWEQVGGCDEELLFCEDYDWFLRAYENRVTKLRLNEVLLFRRLHAASMTHGKSIHDISLARAHHKAIKRRRAGNADAPLPPAFPTLTEYLGHPVQRDTTALLRHDLFGTPSASVPQLARRDSKTLDYDVDALLVFACVRNEALRLPFWLQHYRRLGAARFFVVDNASDDGTAEYLLEQADVYLWHTDAAHAAARSGADWLEFLLRQYGVGHWCVIADADELLYYADCETRPLHDLCAALEQANCQATVGVLLEMYSEKPLRETYYQRGQEFTAVCPYFDRRAWDYESANFYGHYQHHSYFGGMRQRVFGVPAEYQGNAARTFYCLNKTALLKYQPTMQLSAGWHWLRGARVAERAACVLHFKYFATLADASHAAPHTPIWNAQRGQYAAKLNTQNDLTLYDAVHSVRLESSRQLVELGIVREI